MSDTKVLVYHYRAGDAPVVTGGIASITERELDDILEANPKLQRTTMAIDRGVYTVQIAQKNLLTVEQYSGNEDKPNMESKIAHINLSQSIRDESFTELNILSAKR